MNFADRLSAAVADRQSQLVLGLDPDPMRLLPDALGAAGTGSVAERAARAITAHCRILIEVVAGACVAVKLQLACFERLGAPGWIALAQVRADARAAGLLVIADGKRGDVPHSAAAYAQALMGSTTTPFGDVKGLGADAVTASPLLGKDSLEPMLATARQSEAGVFLLVRTSNPGAAAVQDADSGGEPFHHRLAALVAELGAEGVGRCGLSDTGAVVGATEPGVLETLRRLMPQAVFLMPGIGAQGGRVEELGPAFAPGPAAGLVTASRSIVDAALEAGDARAALARSEALRDAAWKLSGR